MIQLARTRLQGSREGGEVWERSWHADTEDEIEQCILAHPTYRGYLSTGDYDADNWEPDTVEAGYIVTIRYGSVSWEQHGPESGEDYGGEAARWSLEPAFQQTAIEKHPEISSLIENYGGEEDPTTYRVTFKRLLPELPREDMRGLLGKNYRDADGNIKNPLYGFNESGYITMGGIASARYVASDVSTAASGIGRVFARLPGRAPDYGIDDNRNWIKMPPSISEVAREESGRRWHEIVHQFMLSDLGGWPPAVYKFIEI